MKWDTAAERARALATLHDDVRFIVWSSKPHVDGFEVMNAHQLAHWFLYWHGERPSGVALPGLEVSKC